MRSRVWNQRVPGRMERDSLALYSHTRCQAGRLPREWKCVLCVLDLLHYVSNDWDSGNKHDDAPRASNRQNVRYIAAASLLLYLLQLLFLCVFLVSNSFVLYCFIICFASVLFLNHIKCHSTFSIWFYRYKMCHSII